jgi:hypothetical protein
MKENLLCDVCNFFISPASQLSGLSWGGGEIKNRLKHDTPTHRQQLHYVTNYHIDLYFNVTQTDPEPPRRWQTTAETCRSQHIE